MKVLFPAALRELQKHFNALFPPREFCIAFCLYMSEDVLLSRHHSAVEELTVCLRIHLSSSSSLVAAQTKEKGSEQKQTDDYVNIVHQ